MAATSVSWVRSEHGVGLAQPGPQHGPDAGREMRGEGRLRRGVTRRDACDPADDIRSLLVARHDWGSL